MFSTWIVLWLASGNPTLLTTPAGFVHVRSVGVCNVTCSAVPCGDAVDETSPVMNRTVGSPDGRETFNPAALHVPAAGADADSS